MMYLRDDEVLFDSNKASEGRSGMMQRRRGQSTESVAVATPREALQEFPRRIDALVQSIVIHAAAGRPFPMPIGLGATPAEAITCREYDDNTKELGAADPSKDRLWREIEFVHRGIGLTNAFPITGCVVRTTSFSDGRKKASKRTSGPSGYMNQWATFGVRKSALVALAKRVGLAIGNRNTGLAVVRYDMGDDEYYWFNIPFRGDGFAFIRGDTGDGISGDEVTLMNNADGIGGGNEPGKQLCTLLVDVGCSVVVPSGTQSDSVPRSKMWGLHLGMLKCILAFPGSSSGDLIGGVRARGVAGSGDPEEQSAEPGHRSARANVHVFDGDDFDDDGDDDDDGDGNSVTGAWRNFRHSRTFTTLTAATSHGVGVFFDGIPSMKTWKFWWCCGSGGTGSVSK